MLKLKEVVSLRKPSIPFPNAGDEIELRIDIELPANDEAYNKNGNYMKVIYDRTKKEIIQFFFFGVRTGNVAEDEYISLDFQEGEEKMLLDFLEDYFKECSMVL